MPRKILVVDDGETNRILLKKILKADYEVFEAENGVEALAFLEREYETTSAVLLDIGMPEMNGYEVLRRRAADSRLAPIPIIVMTGSEDMSAEDKALSLGANDFITKPYNPNIIKHRLKNIINFRETAAIINSAEKDVLTGLYNREAFFRKASEMILEKDADYYTLTCMDIDNFKVINDRYGSAKGDDVLKFVAAEFEKGLSQIGGIICRINADIFAALYPSGIISTGELDHVRERACVPDGIQPVTISAGRYAVDDKGLSISAMYDRAALAKATVKGRFDTHVAQYDESMRIHLLRWQEITNEMNQALESGQFEVWLQPQYNHANGALIGAEALVRWRHPEIGLIPPNEFVPVFEKNGFIYELDKFVWEQVCKLLHRRIEEGRTVLPVSVNVSRYDVLRENLAETILGLVKKYGIAPEMLRLEITESAFAKSEKRVISVVKQLIDCGFTLEIDDFGSGYSSLNTLKDVPAQVVKLDMRFLEDDDNSQRGGSILESVVRMAKWLGMSVIAEGVERIEQADYLKSIGCKYVQGYLYARPMPISEYETIAEKADKKEKMLSAAIVKNLDNNSFWDPSSMDTLIFNSYVGGACVIEYYKGNIEVLRATEKYGQVVSGGALSSEDMLQLSWTKYLDDENRMIISNAIKKSVKTGDEVTGEFVFTGLPNCPEKTYLRATVRVIAVTGERYLIYCMNENITAQRIAEKKEREISRRIRALNENLQNMMNDTPGGYVRMRVYPDGRGEPDYVNDSFCKLLGMTNAEIMRIYGGDVTAQVHPEDTKIVAAAIRRAFGASGRTDAKYRARHKDGEYVWLQMFGRLTKNGDGDCFLNAYFADLSEQEKREISFRDTMPILLKAIMKSSTALAFAKDRDFKYICCSGAFARFAGQEDESGVVGKTDFELFPKENAEQFRRDDIALFKSGESIVDKEEPIPSHDKVQHYSSTSKYVLRDALGSIVGLYGIGNDITESRNSYSQLKLLTDSIPGGIATYMCTPSGVKITYFSDGFCATLGCSREEYEQFSSSNPMSTVFGEDMPLIMEQLERLKKDGTPIDCTYRIHNMHGSGHKWINLRGVLFERHGENYIVNTVQYDVTEAKRTEEEMRRAQESIQTSNRLVEDSSSAVYVADAETYKLLYVNKNCARMCGKTVAEAHGKTCYEFLKGLDKPCEFCYMSIVNDDKYTEREYSSPKSGKHYMTRGKFIDWDGRRAIVEYLSDATESVNARLNLQASHHAMELASRNCGISFWQYDIDRRTLKWGDYKHTSYLGYDSVMKNMPDYMIDSGDVHPQDVDIFRKMYDELSGDAESAECTARLLNRKTGKYIWHHTVYTRLHDPFYTTRQAIGIAEVVDLQQELKMRYEHELQLRHEIIRNADNYVEINLTSGTVEDYRSKYQNPEKLLLSRATGGSFGEGILELVAEVDREAVRNAFFADNLLKYYYSGTNTVTLEYRRVLPDGGMCWLRGTATIMTRPSTGEVIAFIYSENIDKEKKSQLAISGVLNEEIDSLSIINVRSGLAYLIKAQELLYDINVGVEFCHDDYIMRIIDSHIASEDRERCRAFFPLERLKAALAENAVATMNYKVCDNGSKLSWRRTVAYYLDDTHEDIVLFRRDITAIVEEERRQRERLQKAVDEATEANHAKSDFLSRMSHDMRTPMNAVIGLAELARKETDTQRLEEYLSKIDTSSRFLLGLINDALDLNRIADGKLELAEETFSLDELESGINAVIRPLMEKKGIAFTFEPGDNKYSVCADKQRFNQIFFNLLSNAAKYTPTGGHVEFIAERLPDREGLCGKRWLVRDNGAGMNEEFVKIAFEPFSQEQPDETSALQGAGLGLAIAKCIVEAMDGTISVKSERGKGSEFTVELYMKKAVAAEEQDGNKPIDFSSLSGARILLVEDNETNVLVARRLLEHVGCVVSVARNGLEAVRMFSDSEPCGYDAVIMDVRMPVMDGLEATRQIRALDRADAADVPIIAVTADTFTDDKNKTIRAGMNAHISKPIETKLLFSTLMREIGKRKRS